MDTQKIIDLAHQLQEALPFDWDGIKSKEQYKEAIVLANKLTDSHDDNNSILYEVLCTAISRYEDSSPEFTAFNKCLIKLDDDTSISVPDYSNFLSRIEAKREPVISFVLNAYKLKEELKSYVKIHDIKQQEQSYLLFHQGKLTVFATSKSLKCADILELIN